MLPHKTTQAVFASRTREAYCLSIRVILLPEGFEEGDSAKN